MIRIEVLRNKTKLAALLAMLFAGQAPSQTRINGGRVITGAWDASGAASSKPAKTGTVLPSTCGVGEQFFKTNATVGQNLYFCTASNTWIQMTGGSGGGGGGAPSVLLFKGDLAGFSTQDSRIPVGPDGSVLTADSTQGAGVGYHNISGSGPFAGRPVCTTGLTGQTYFPTDGLLGYRCNGSAWTAFGPLSPVTPMRVGGTNQFGVTGPGSTTLTGNVNFGSALPVASCQSFPATVGMVLVDSEVVAGTCAGTTFTPIAGGRGYNQTSTASHNTGALITEQLFVWGNTLGGTSTQGSSNVVVSGGYLALTDPAGLPMLIKPIPNGPGAGYTVTGGFTLNGLSSGDQGCGLGYRQSSNNNESLVLYHAVAGGAGFNVGQYRFTDSSFAGAYFNLNAGTAILGTGLYFRLQGGQGQRNVFVSTDGLNFALVHSVPDNDYLVADQVMIGCTGGAIPTLGSFFSWSEQ